MFGLDEWMAGAASGQGLFVVAVVAALLGLRHATDPDHLTAVSTLVAAERRRTASCAGTLGAAWGLGHATTLFAVGLPIIIFDAFLPPQVQTAAEVAVGLLIMALALRVIMRWRSGRFHAHEHFHGEVRHRHLHAHAEQDGHAHEHVSALGRGPLAAYGIGLVHGVGGSAGVGVLLLAAIPHSRAGVTALLVFATLTAVSMAVASASFGYLISRGPLARRFDALAPALGTVSLIFGLWYALGAVGALPY